MGAFWATNLPKAVTPRLDKVMHPLMSSQAKGRDNELAKSQAFCLDAFVPLTPQGGSVILVFEQKQANFLLKP